MASRTQLVLALLVSATVGLVGGCALFKGTTVDQATEKLQTEVSKVVEPTIAVLQCVSFVQRMAFDSGKRLSTAAAVAFCTALEQSPDVVVTLMPGADS